MAELNEVGQPKWQTRSPLPSVDWDTYFDAVQQAFVLHLESAGPPGQKAPVLVADVPKTNEGNFDTSFDVITFKIVQSVRAATDPSGKRRFPKGPNIREVKPHPTKARYSLVTFGWWEQVDVRFTIFALSRDRADEITKWFHYMMMSYCFFLDFFRARGVQDMRFLKRGEDDFSKMYGQELYVRTLDYSVRLELLQSFERKGLESIEIIADETPEITLQEQYIIPKP
jgi:hypothetical protein